ncbi:gluconate 2-dehydrogenase subunit 3 family protein [Pedobacter frigoris]|uniref:Gluconate 2-dehydrogenase subunit 3 family protein n=1 Tax=Pedobacter frigoris TaxID=2571272 RepID=A0A4U1CU92_9SPHI|nr:gluconate 2-dehydrogenase subunit 3 family protein [Pedobacter frigoris]TKC09569.1 gluconate 2-dehydrogenase subunit 3 family protein [Pedobacter frigoris]
MERRLAIKQVLILAGGMMVLPSCLRESGKASIELKNLDIDLDQENILAEITEMIIPKTDTPGAKDLKLHLFVLKMVDDCYEKKDQQIFSKGLEYVCKLEEGERKQFVIDANAKKEQLNGDAYNFFNMVKDRTIGGYMNSKYVMSNLVIWELVPGRYNGYFPVKNI